MTLEELDVYLHKVEDFEEDNYRRCRNYLKRTNWDRADALEQKQIWRNWEQESKRQQMEMVALQERAFYRQETDRVPVLTYQLGEYGEVVSARVQENQGYEIASRALITAEEGVRKWLTIQKHSRYYWCFTHMHSFVEMNYCYSGEILDYVNGEEIILHPGDLVIMEPGSEHYIGACRDDDILMNLILYPSSLTTLLEKVIPGDSKLADFLIQALERGYGRNNYVIIRGEQDEKLKHILEETLCEFFDEKRVASEEMTGYLIQIIFTMLWRISEEEPERVTFGYNPDSKAYRILAYIRDHAVDCTRDSVAEHFGYSGSRISNLLTEQFGKSFVAIRNEMRLEMAEKLLQTTNLPVQQIAEQVGVPNQTHFYKLYRAYFGRLPRH